MQFGLSGLFNLGSYSGNSLIAAKYGLSGNTALRFGLSGSFSSYSVVQNFSNFNADSETTNSASVSVTNPASSLSVGINGDYLYYINPNDTVKAYIGAGPTFGITYGTGTAYSAVQSGTNSSAYSSFSWYAGARLCLGAEWLITKNFGLFAEYGLNVKYVSQNYNLTNNSETTSYYNNNSSSTGTNGISISPFSIQMGIDVFF